MQHLLVLLSVLLWLATSAQAATYFVSTAGNNSNACTAGATGSSTKRTFTGGSGALTCLSAGDTLKVESGVYDEVLVNVIPNGVTIEAVNIGTCGSKGGTCNAIVKNPTSGSLGDLGHDNSTIRIFGINVTVRGIEFDANGWGRYAGDFQGTIASGGNLTFERNYFHHARFSILFLSGTNSRLRFSNIAFPGIGCGSSVGAHGIYAPMDHWTLENNYIHDTEPTLVGCPSDPSGWGIQIFASGPESVNDNIFRGNVMERNRAHLFVDGSQHLITNNMLCGAGNVAINVNATTDSKFYHNTIIGSGNEGINCSGNPTYNDGSAPLRNNLVFGNTPNIQSNCTNVGSTNRTTSVSFVNQAQCDLHLTAAEDGGSSAFLADVPTDIDGDTRPAGSAPDRGADEFGGTGPSGSPLTIFVSPTGNDTVVCQNAGMSTPRQTLAAGLACMTVPGSTLYLRGGTYTEVIETASQPIAGGVDWSTPSTVAGYGAETVILQTPTGGDGVGIKLNNPVQDHYLLFDRLIVDNQNQGNAVAVLGGAHDIRVQNSEIKNSLFETVYVDGATNVEILNTLVHDSSASACINAVNTAMGVVVRKSTVYNCAREGVRADNGQSVTIRESTIHHAGVPQSRFAVRIGGAGNNASAILNAVLYANYGGIWLNSGASAVKVYNSTVHGSTGTVGLQIDNGASNTQVKNMIVSANTGGQITNNDPSTVQTNTILANPGYVDAAAGDFRLLPSATTAIDQGTTLAETALDRVDVPRPQPAGGAYDLGAYECPAPCTAPLPPSGALQLTAPTWQQSTGFLRR